MARFTRPSANHAAFTALPTETKAAIAAQVYQIMEYDRWGDPGAEWDSDTTQALAEMFGAYGVSFTDPGDEPVYAGVTG